MKRSAINSVIRESLGLLEEHKSHLPPFAHWSPDDWRGKWESAKEIVESGLGWDIMDFGMNDFARFGLLLFTIRNGSPQNLEQGRGKLYAEKILVVGPDQVTPLHFHWHKMEDIINRGEADSSSNSTTRRPRRVWPRPRSTSASTVSPGRLRLVVRWCWTTARVLPFGPVATTSSGRRTLRSWPARSPWSMMMSTTIAFTSRWSVSRITKRMSSRCAFCAAIMLVIGRSLGSRAVAGLRWKRDLTERGQHWL